MLPATDKSASGRDYLKLAQIHAAIQRREHEQRRRMVVKDILKKEGDIDYKVPATDYLKTFKPKLIGCSALHSAFNAGNADVFNEILQHGADFAIEYDGLSAIHRAVEENFDKREMSKLAKRFKEYANANFTTPDINSFIIMSKVVERKNVSECDNWRLRSQLDDQFVQSILSLQIKNANPVNPQSKNGISHFHAACMANNSTAVKLFLDSGVDVNETVKTDSPVYSAYKPIHFAVRCSGLETVQELLKYKVDVDAKDAEGKTPLQILVDHNIKVREWMSTKKALPYDNAVGDYVKNEKIISLLIDNAKTADCLDPLPRFYAACTLKSPAMAESLMKKITNIKSCVDVSSSTWPGYTALHFAAFFSMESVKLLLKNGGDIGAKDKNETTPLDVLVTRASIKDLHYILSTRDEWKNIVLSDGKTRLLDLIASMENPSSFDNFLNDINVNAHVPVDSPLWPGYTILHLAVMFSETAKIQQFLNDIVDCTGANYRVALEKCCREQEEAYHGRVLVCLRRNAKVHVQEAHGRTPIHLAFRQRKVDVVTILSQHMKDLENLTDEDNLSFLHIFCAAGYKELVERLMPSNYTNQPILPSFKWDSNFYHCDDVFGVVGSTPLHLAVSRENVEIVKLLVSGGADVNVKDAAGLTAVHRIFALKNVWKIGNEMFNWTDMRRSMMMFDSPEMDRYRQAMGNLKNISEALLSSPTSITGSIDSSFSIHQRSTDNASHNYSFESGETLLQQGVDILAKRADGSIWLFDKLKYPYRDDITFIVTILSQDQALRSRLKEQFGWTILHVASSLYNVDLVKESLAAGIDVNASTSKDSPIYPGCTPLHILMMSLDGNRSYSESEQDYEAVLRILLENGADVTLTDANNDTPLHRSDYSRFWSSRSFKDSIYTEELLKHIKNFKVNSINDRGISLFHVACLKQNYRAIAEFLKQGVDVNQPVDFFAYDPMDMDEFTGSTALHMALKELPKSSDVEFPLEIVELLLKHGADVHAVDAFGNTPLHVAAAADVPSEKLLELLIEKGADVNAENVSGKRPLEMLLHGRRTSKKEIEVFLKHGCRLNTFNPLSQVGYMALLLRIGGRSAEQRETVLDMAMKCPSIKEIDELGRTAVHNIVASYDFNDEDDFDPIEYFMRYGGDIDHQDRLGRTALHVAAQFRSYEAARGLLSSGADINIVDANGQTAFAYALDPQTDLVDLTLDFNHSVNKHLVIEVFAEYVYNMQLRGVYVNEVNKEAQTRAINEFHVRINEISSSFDSIRNEKIGSTSLKLDDFMSETGAVATYPKKSPVEREEIDKFFTITIKDSRFYEWRFLCKLQYRKSLARAQLVELAKDAMNAIIQFPLPYLCFDVIQQFLSNADLKNLNAAIASK